MASFLSPPHLSIAGSTTVGRSDLTVVYQVLFDALDINTDQTYHAHATVVGDDRGPGGDGHDDTLYEWGIGDFHASMVPYPGLPLLRTITFSVPNTTLNEDPGTNPTTGKPWKDEIKVLVTLTPQVGAVVGPTPTNIVNLTL
jgi:hypothetical protein